MDGEGLTPLSEPGSDKSMDSSVRHRIAEEADAIERERVAEDEATQAAEPDGPGEDSQGSDRDT
jgi:hypothetical protein